MSVFVEASEELLGGLEEAGAEGGVAEGAIKSADEVLAESKSAIKDAEAEIKIEEKAAFDEGINEVKDNIENLKDPAEASKLKTKWTVKNIWQNAKSFGKFVGIEAAKGALFTAGMEAVQKIAEAIKDKQGNPDDHSALVLANKLAGVAASLQEVLTAWLLWFANHYDDRDSYGSVTVEGTEISRFQIVQNKIADASKVLETKVGPALTVATKNNNLSTMKSLKDAYVELYNKMAAVSSDITSKEEKMVADGLDSFKAKLDAAKATLDSA